MQMINSCTFILLVIGLHMLEATKKSSKAVLPPPDADADAKTEVGPNGEIRGIKGNSQKDTMSQIQKSTKACEREGSEPIKGECSKYNDCKRVGALPQAKFCVSGKFFDHKKRMCIKTSEAECKDVCPKEGLTMADPNTNTGFLKCMKGIPVQLKCKKASWVFIPARGRCGVGSGKKEDDEGDDD